MKRIIYKVIGAALIMGFFNSCYKETGYPGPSPSIEIVARVNGELPVDELLILPRFTKCEVSFDITASNNIKRIEMYRISGIPANTNREEYQPESSLIQLQEKKGVPEGLGITQITLKDTLTIGENEVGYSVFVQDINSEFQLQKVFILTDIAKFTNIIQDGNPDGSTKSFLSLTSGRSFNVYNTIQDPKGIDLGFAYLESVPTAKACLISLDEYWKTGSYAGVVNNYYSPMEFRKANPDDTIRYIDRTVTPDDLKTFFDRGTEYAVPLLLGFTPGKIAPVLRKNDYIAFKIRGAYYGLLKVQNVRSHSRPDFTQQITIQFIVQRKTKYE